MKLLGFNFRKIKVERNKQDLTNLKIETNMSIPEVRKIKDSLLKSKEDILEFDFEYAVIYSPGIAEITLAGTLILAVEEEMSKEIMKNWKKNKLPEEVRMAIFNVVLKKSNIKALNLEDELNLPYHVPLPSLKKSEDKKTE